MIENMDLVFTLGQTVDRILANGKMANNTVKVNISKLMDLKGEASGRMVKESNG